MILDNGYGKKGIESYMHSDGHIDRCAIGYHTSCWENEVKNIVVGENEWKNKTKMSAIDTDRQKEKK